MKRHYITRAASNSAVALSMAKESWWKEGWPKGQSNEDVQDLVQLIDSTSIKLIAACERHARNTETEEKT